MHVPEYWLKDLKSEINFIFIKNNGNGIFYMEIVLLSFILIIAYIYIMQISIAELKIKAKHISFKLQ